MKKFIFAAFIAFWASIATVAVLEMLTPRPANTGLTGESSRFDMREVAEHDVIEDCWMVIEGRVYDLTDYIARHPTPPSVLEPWCGKQATEGMRTKGIGRDHSAAAWAMLEDYLIGELRGD